MNISITALKYIIFAVIATLANLGAQRFILSIGKDENPIILAILIGTIIGLVIKYQLDKKWIFYFKNVRFINETGNFFLYSFFGLFTTSIFWITELFFWITTKDQVMRELGAIIGLTIGYILKYHIDKKYIFKKKIIIGKDRMKITGWGRFPCFETTLITPRNIDELKQHTRCGSFIARGNGRSYGDSSINENKTICMKEMDNFLNFDNNNGELIVQSGVLIKDIINIFVKKGWFVPVTPGTKFVTVGGMVASDVHGKNHHKHGSFGNFIEWIEILNVNGKILKCSKQKNSKLFNLTIGGMGLTGIILKVAFKLTKIETSWIKQTIIPAQNLDHIINLFDEFKIATYSVAWIDCLSSGSDFGRALMFLGEHALKSDLNKYKQKEPLKLKEENNFNIMFNFPKFILNKFFIKVFNSLYFHYGKFKNKNSLVEIKKFFYPLDALLNWNRIYGKSGFIQFQCVLPINNSTQGITEILNFIKREKGNAFLAVLKKLGKEERYISFPMEGYTISLDFAVNENNIRIVEKLDEIVLKYKGRFYLSKDSRMKSNTLFQADKRYFAFSNIRKKNKLDTKFQSAQSIRLKI